MGKPGKKKKFIDKKNSVTFHLVHRSQKDPLAADEDAPGYVLEPVGRINKDVKLDLPPTVFASEVEEEVGLLNKAAPIRGPRPDLDPDIVATLDDEFDGNESEEEGLEDDFILKANAEVSEESDDENANSNDELWDDFDCDDNKTVKSRFTEYSISSSVLPRSKGLQLLDDRFEKMYEQYDDDEIGALDEDDITGYITTESEIFKHIVEDYEKKQALERSKEIVNQLEERWREKGESDSDVEPLDKLIVEEPTEKWDCESILSTYSNLYNHPQLIKEPPKIRISPKTGIPKDTLHQKLTAKNLKKLDNSTTSKPSTPVVCSRKKHEKETPEEKHDRKKAVKEHRRERRVEKKANKEAFKEEKKLQEKILFNVQKNVQGIKLA